MHIEEGKEVAVSFDLFSLCNHKILTFYIKSGASATCEATGGRQGELRKTSELWWTLIVMRKMTMVQKMVTLLCILLPLVFTPTTIIFCMPGVWPQADNPNGWKEEERETGLNQHQKSQLNFTNCITFLKVFFCKHTCWKCNHFKTSPNHIFLFSSGIWPEQSQGAVELLPIVSHF